MASLSIPVTKGKSTVSIDTKDIPDEVYNYIVQLGLKELVNRGMTKITVAKLEGDDLAKAQAAAMAQAEKNIEAIKTGKVRMTGAKAKSVGGAVMTEATRLAKIIIKASMKEQGIKVSYVPAKEITAAAKAYLETDEGKPLIEEATANLSKREADATAASAVLKTIVTPGMIDPAKKAKAEAERAKANDVLSAAQAGKVKKSKGKGGAQANA